MILTLQNRILEMIARGAPLADTAVQLCLDVERYVPEAICSVLLIDESGRIRPLAGPSLPESYSSALDGVQIGPSVGSCGTAACLKSAVTVTDISQDPLWEGFRSLAADAGLKACWSSPICHSGGRVLGTFAFYYREIRGPGDREKEIVAACVNLCSIAIERETRVNDRLRMAYEDHLSGLGNRAAFMVRMADLEILSSLLLIDIDNLKTVNDAFGHAAGDDLIRGVAQRLAAIAPASSAFRLGGDEFAVVLPPSNRSSQPRDTAAGVLRSLLAPMSCDGNLLVARATIGGATLEAVDDDASAMKQRADIALYHAKETARGEFLPYDPQLATSITRRAQLIRDVTAALLDGRVEAFYQPIVCFNTGRTVGARALCRIRTLDGSSVETIHCDDNSIGAQLAASLTLHMLDLVATDVAKWDMHGTSTGYVSLSVSATDFRSRKLSATLSVSFKQAGAPMHRLVLEINRSAPCNLQDEPVRSQLHALKSMGVRIALANFGSGPFTMLDLLTAPIDIVMIDRLFIDLLADDERCAAILESLVDMARKLGITTTAEGVATLEQLERLEMMGCESGHGPLFPQRMSDPLVSEFVRRCGRPAVLVERPRSEAWSSPTLIHG